jgi:hypothetical protein
MTAEAIGACLAYLTGRLETEVVSEYWRLIALAVPPQHALWIAQYEWDC